MRLSSSRGTDVGLQNAHLLRELNNHLANGGTAESLLSVRVPYDYNLYTLTILSILILRTISPKVYIRDTGILNFFLELKTEAEILRHQTCGASWEGLVIEQLIRTLNIDYPYFWATHQRAEIDLVFNKGGRMYGIEIKRADAPTITPSMKNALEDLKLERIAVIYLGKKGILFIAKLMLYHLMRF